MTWTNLTALLLFVPLAAAGIVGCFRSFERDQASMTSEEQDQDFNDGQW